MADASPALSYENAFAELEEVLLALESGELALEESLALYEKGLALSAYCGHLLDQAELRVRQWQTGQETTALEGWQEG
jgi:exodeoxyribonuclease VII small subunit